MDSMKELPVVQGDLSKLIEVLEHNLLAIRPITKNAVTIMNVQVS